ILTLCASLALACPSPRTPSGSTAPTGEAPIAGGEAPELSRAAENKAAAELERARRAEVAGDDLAAAAAYEDAASALGGDAAAASLGLGAGRRGAYGARPTRAAAT